MYKGSPKPRDLVPIVTLTANGFTPGEGFFYIFVCRPVINVLLQYPKYLSSFYMLNYKLFTIQTQGKIVSA